MAAAERTLTINLRKEIMKVPDYKRAKKAVTAIREFLQRHMKAEAKDVKIGKYLNLKIWEHGIKKPIHKVTVVAKKDDKGIVTAELPNIPVKKQNEKRLKAKEKQGKKEANPNRAKHDWAQSAKADLGAAEKKETKAEATPATTTIATTAAAAKTAESAKP